MKLLLLDYDYKFDDGSAEIKDGILYIYRPGCFNDVMYKMTYLIFGKKECYFCHRKFLELSEPYSPECLYVTQTTLDHLIPQEFGGPTITNNMRPTCCRCNSMKSNMYPEEFAEYVKLLQSTEPDQEEKIEQFKQTLLEVQGERRKGNIETLPQEWYTQDQIQNVYASIWVKEPLGASYRKQEKAYKHNKYLSNAVIVSKNRFVLDGFNTILVAKKNHISRVRIIVLDNVIYYGFPIYDKENAD